MHNGKKIFVSLSSKSQSSQGLKGEFYEVRTIMPPIVTTRPIFLALCVDLILKAYPQSFPPTPSIFAEVEEEKIKDSQWQTIIFPNSPRPRQIIAPSQKQEWTTFLL